MAAYGYARVSTSDQTTDPQVRVLLAAGVPEAGIIRETISGTVPAASRPRLAALLERLVRGDSLAVARLDRLGRGPADTLTLLRDLEAQGVAVRLLDMGADTATPAGRLVVAVLAAVAGWEAETIRERTMAGLASARAKGRVGGRRPALDAAQADHVRQLHAAGRSLREIAAVTRTLKGRTPSPETIRRTIVRAI